MWRVAKNGLSDLRSFLWTWPAMYSKGLQRSTMKEISLPVVAKRPVPKIVRPTPKNALEIQEGLSTVVYRTTTMHLDVLRLVERVGVIEYHGDGMGIRDEELLLL